MYVGPEFFNIIFNIAFPTCSWLILEDGMIRLPRIYRGLIL